MYSRPECEGDHWTPRTISHATFTEAMAMLGIDVRDLMGLTIGNWQDDDDLLFGWTRIMRQNPDNMWRIKYSGSESTTAKGSFVGYIGIDRPVYEEDDDESPAAQ